MALNSPQIVPPFSFQSLACLSHSQRASVTSGGGANSSWKLSYLTYFQLLVRVKLKIGETHFGIKSFKVFCLLSLRLGDYGCAEYVNSPLDLKWKSCPGKLVGRNIHLWAYLHMTLLSPMPITSCEQVRPICLALAHPPIEPRLDSTIFDTADFRLCRRSPFIASQCRGQPEVCISYWGNPRNSLLSLTLFSNIICLKSICIE